MHVFDSNAEREAPQALPVRPSCENEVKNTINSWLGFLKFSHLPTSPSCCPVELGSNASRRLEKHADDGHHGKSAVCQLSGPQLDLETSSTQKFAAPIKACGGACC